jgi:hypothetical protein
MKLRRTARKHRQEVKKPEKAEPESVPNPGMNYYIHSFIVYIAHRHGRPQTFFPGEGKKFPVEVGGGGI